MRVSILLFLMAILALNAAFANSAGSHVLQLSIDGAIGPATDDYIGRALITAAEPHAELVVIRMDTPGGLDSAMRGIIKSNHQFRRACGKLCGAERRTCSQCRHLHPVCQSYCRHGTGHQCGGGYTGQDRRRFSPGSKGKDKQDKAADKDTVAAGDAKQQKIINDAVAYMRSLAELRGRNQEWAEKAVREAASIPASEALQMDVIDIIASDMADLLKQIDGREVMVQGQKRTLQTSGSAIVQLAPDWRSRFLNVITNPNVAYILMLIGIYGLMLEFSNPGAIVPGTIGAICLLLALYSFQLLPVNYAGMGLILLVWPSWSAKPFNPVLACLVSVA